MTLFIILCWAYHHTKPLWHKIFIEETAFKYSRHILNLVDKSMSRLFPYLLISTMFSDPYYLICSTALCFLLPNPAKQQRLVPSENSCELSLLGKGDRNGARQIENNHETIFTSLALWVSKSVDITFWNWWFLEMSPISQNLEYAITHHDTLLQIGFPFQNAV